MIIVRVPAHDRNLIEINFINKEYNQIQSLKKFVSTFITLYLFSQLHLYFSPFQGFIPKFCTPILQPALYLHFFLFFFLPFYKESARTHTSGREGQRENPKQVPCSAWSLMWDSIPQTWDHDLS